MWLRETSVSEPLMRCRNDKDEVKTEDLFQLRDKFREELSELQDILKIYSKMLGLSKSEIKDLKDAGII